MASYYLNFYPYEFAFTIYPLPSLAEMPHNWQFEDDDEIVVTWAFAERYSDIEQPTLVFKRVPDDQQGDRQCPVHVFKDDQWIPQTSNVVKISMGTRLKIAQVRDGARWSFDFTCTNPLQQNLTVDPEMQIGTGTSN